jgi:rod shape-determining protein MreC
MSANTAQRKSHWILAGLLLSQIVLMTANARHPESEQSILRTWLMTPLSFVSKTFNGAITWVSSTVASYVDLRGAREENIELRAKVEQLTAERNQALERTVELDSLRRQVALPAHTEHRTLAANVIARNPSLWFQRLVIDRGTLDGVKLNMPVTAGSGVLGRVISVGPNYATVQVITDKLAGLGAMLQTSRAMGEIRGLGEEGRLELKSIRSSEAVQVDESVVTTGLDRIYPKGLLVGTVERIDDDPNAPWHRIIVKPAAAIDRVEHVQVLLVEQKDLRMEEPAR